MKKCIITTIIAVSAAMAQAVTFSWKIQSSAQLKFNNSSIAGNGTAYLVFLGTDTISDVGFDSAITQSTVGETSTSLGKVNKSVDVTVSGNGGGNYGLYVVYQNEGDTWYNVSSSSVSLTASEISGLLDSGTALDTGVFTFANTMHEKTDPGAVGSGWYMKQTTPDIPEPATGALALAGIALLFKRRRA